VAVAAKDEMIAKTTPISLVLVSISVRVFSASESLR